MKSARVVTAPIRYGRLSTTRGDTYTMVFSRLCTLGQGIAVRCKRSVSTSEELFVEAEALWKAELPSAPAHRLASDWGCVALLPNPDRKTPVDIVEAWAERAGGETDYGQVTQARDEGTLVSAASLLQIPWTRIVSSGEPLPLDLLLATTNDPTLVGTPGVYPTVEMIANAWNEAGGRYAEYFWKNIENGIHTFQDDEIRERLNSRGSEGAV